MHIKSKLKEFIYSLDNNLNEFVGENAVKLSGGQAQRLAIARAIYHDAQLIIFTNQLYLWIKKTREKFLRVFHL